MIDNEELQIWIDRIDTELVRYFSKKDMTCNPLDRAMEYTILAGGKRLRPLLGLITCQACGGDPETAIPFAMATEFIHTYSLIHDDLPCMDDDDMRRGKPTNHVIFGEANAVLAGDALQAEAFAILAETEHPNLKPERRIRIISELAQAIGRRGMVAGQVMDLGDAGKTIDLQRLALLHSRKTGALLTYCVRLGAHLADADDETLQALTTYAEAMGLMFQVVDDLLDLEAESETLGKTAGKDAAQDKATYPKLMGHEEAHEYADHLLDQALAALKETKLETGFLAGIAKYIRNRDY